MGLTLAQIRASIRDSVKSQKITSTTIDRWANNALEELWREIHPSFAEETVEFTTTAGQRAYYFDGDWNRVISISDVDNQVFLNYVTETDIEKADPNIDDTGSPTAYTMYGVSYVNAQPTSSSTLSVVSSSLDDTSQKVQIVGETSDGVLDEEVSLNGTTAVVSSLSYTRIISISKSDVTAGAVTITSNAGAVTNVRLGARDIFKQFQTIYFWPIPDGNYSMRGRFFRKPKKMIKQYDIPDLPENWHSLLLKKVEIKAHDYLYEFDVMAAKMTQAAKDLEVLKASQAIKPNWRPKVGTARYRKQIGRLPSNFPGR